MALRLFIDHCVPLSIARALEAEGYEVLLLRDHLPTDAPDADVIAEAQRSEAVLVTLNGDFADLVAYPPERYGGILALQVRNRPQAVPTLIARLLDLLRAHTHASYYTGKLFLVEPHRVRVRG
jgi:predicted nuclease of predicted toxin-antitoxin system